MKLTIDNRHIKLEEILDASTLALSLDRDFRSLIASSFDLLNQELEKGTPLYGITTGYGSSGKNYVQNKDAYTLQENLYRYHGCGVGELLSKEASRIITIARLISLSKGYSGVSLELLERFEMLINQDIIPAIPSKGSVGASGDLTPLSYIAAVIAGEREVHFGGSVVPTSDVYAKLSITPYRFKPKEALSIMNGTSVMSGIALLAIAEFDHILDKTESFVAGIYEVLLCDHTPLQEFVHASKPFRGQIKSASNIYKKIEGSKLTHGREERYSQFFKKEELNIQDNYSIRCAPQVLGVIRDALISAKEWVEQEINSVNDNPLIDGINKQIYTSGNFYGGYVAHAMDSLKICAATLADLLDKEFGLLIDAKYNRGLGENLKISDEPYHHGFKAMQITLSSLSGDVIKNAAPVSILSRPTESMNQDRVSMGTTAALDFKRSVDDLYGMLAIALMGLAQAVDIRGSELCSKTLQELHSDIRALSSVVIEDRRLDIDIKKVEESLRAREHQRCEGFPPRETQR